MAKPTTLPFSKFLLLVGDGADPEVFAAPCGLTSRAFNQTASVQETTVPDCDDEDAPADVERMVESLSRSISGSGVLAMGSRAVWQDWYDSGASKNVRVKLDETLANDGGYWEGRFVLTTFNVSAEKGQKARVEIELQSDRAVVWHDAAA